MSGIHRLNKSMKRVDASKEDSVVEFSGILGIQFNGQRLVEVPNRDGYVYVRLRSNLNEVIQAYNGAVSPVYDLPVIVVRDRLFNRYNVKGRDLGRYEDWGSSAYLPRHGAQHSFSDYHYGGDIVWVHDRQFVPLSIAPSGSNGSANVLVNGDVYYYNADWKYAGNTGSPSLLPYKPTGSNARIVLIYLDTAGNPQLEPGDYMDYSVTGINQIVDYLPTIPGSNGTPLGAVRLLSGTSRITWSNIYDLRPLVVTQSDFITPYIVQDEGVTRTRRSYLNFKGQLVWAIDNAGDDATDIIISGSSAHVIQDEGITKVPRTNLNFKGSPIWVDDNAGADSTDVSVSGSTSVGYLNIGSSTSYTEIQNDGSIILHGNARAFRDELYALIGQRLESPSSDIIQNNAEGTVTFKDSATLADYVTMTIQINHDWATGTNIEPHLHWFQSSATMPNWLIQYRWQINGQTKTTAWTTGIKQDNKFTYATGTTMVQITDFPSITPPANAYLSDMIQLRLLRDSDNDTAMFSGTDDALGDIDALQMDIHIEVDSLGSRLEYTK